MGIVIRLERLHLIIICLDIDQNALDGQTDNTDIVIGPFLELNLDRPMA